VTLLLAIAVVAGGAAGLATGGRLGEVARVQIGWGWLLALGVIGQILLLDGVVPVHGSVELAGILASYAALAVFALLNLGRAGMGVLVLGVLLNAAPIAADSGMPVEAHAIVSARIATAQQIPLLDFGGKRHLARQGDHLRLIDDNIPDWPTHEVLSIGDLVITAGVGAVIFGLVRPRGRRTA
jgi:hypothetical protein